MNRNTLTFLVVCVSFAVLAYAASLKTRTDPTLPAGDVSTLFTINEDGQAFAGNPLPSTVTRYYDPEAMTVCYVYRENLRGGISCLPLGHTDLSPVR